jgi:hypothetical protein
MVCCWTGRSEMARPADQQVGPTNNQKEVKFSVYSVLSGSIFDLQEQPDKEMGLRSIRFPISLQGCAIQVEESPRQLPATSGRARGPNGYTQTVLEVAMIRAPKGLASFGCTLGTDGPRAWAKATFERSNSVPRHKSASGRTTLKFLCI